MLFFGKNIRKYKKILKNFSSQNKDFWPPKCTKKYSFENNGYATYLRKVKSRLLSLFTKNTQT